MNKEFEKWYNDQDYWGVTDFNNLPSDLQLGVYLRFIRESRGVVIYVYRNGSGYLWSMEMDDSGTDLGWSDHSGDCPFSGTFTSFDKAAMDAIELELEFGCYHDLCKDKTPIGHWGGYVSYLMDLRNIKQTT